MRLSSRAPRYTHLFCIAVPLFLALASVISHAQTATELYSFKGTGDGKSPYGNLIADSSGNLYGTTFGGGSQYCGGGCGVVFELSPVQGGGWTYTVLYKFAGRSFGEFPQSGLLLNPSTGDLFGTAEGGRFGSGIVFSLHQSGGVWKEDLVYHFFGGPDGNNPAASGLIADSSFHLYGSTWAGGDLPACNFGGGCGVIYELSLLPNGRWSQRVLHTFTGPDGAHPFGNLAIDSLGNLYGATTQGGPGDGGIVFKLTQNPGGSWKETILHSFAAMRFSNGWNTNSVALDLAGNVYGTNSNGGVSHNAPGNVFELSPAGQNWQETVLHDFVGFSDGASPDSAPVFDSAGNLFGTTGSGGPSNAGTIYKLTPNGNNWTYSIYYDFTADIGQSPLGSVLIDSTGNLYGTTENGGAFGMGAIYKIAP